MNSLVIIGRRWFDKVNGNTYHSVCVLVDGEEVGRVPFAYGYGSQYEQSAAELLYKLDLLPSDSERSWRNCWPLSLHCRNNGIAYHSEVADVARKRDL